MMDEKYDLYEPSVRCGAVQVADPFHGAHRGVKVRGNWQWSERDGGWEMEMGGGRGRRAGRRRKAGEVRGKREEGRGGNR